MFPFLSLSQAEVKNISTSSTDIFLSIKNISHLWSDTSLRLSSTSRYVTSLKGLQEARSGKTLISQDLKSVCLQRNKFDCNDKSNWSVSAMKRDS